MKEIIPLVHQLPIRFRQLESRFLADLGTLLLSSQLALALLDAFERLLVVPRVLHLVSVRVREEVAHADIDPHDRVLGIIIIAAAVITIVGIFSFFSFRFLPSPTQLHVDEGMPRSRVIPLDDDALDRAALGERAMQRDGNVTDLGEMEPSLARIEPEPALIEVQRLEPPFTLVAEASHLLAVLLEAMQRLDVRPQLVVDHLEDFRVHSLPFRFFRLLERDDQRLGVRLFQRASFFACGVEFGEEAVVEPLAEFQLLVEPSSDSLRGVQPVLVREGGRGRGHRHEVGTLPRDLAIKCLSSLFSMNSTVFLP